MLTTASNSPRAAESRSATARMPPKRRGSVRNATRHRRHHGQPRRAAAAAAARDAATGGGDAAGGGAAGDGAQSPPAAVTPAPAQAQAPPHATAEGSDSVVAMDVGDGDAGGGGGVVDASRRRTRTGLGPVEAMECDEVDVLEKIGARTMRATVAICYVRYFRAPPKGRDWYGRTDGVIAAIRKHLSTALAMELEYRCATARLASPRLTSQDGPEGR